MEKSEDPTRELRDEEEEAWRRLGSSLTPFRPVRQLVLGTNEEEDVLKEGGSAAPVKHPDPGISDPKRFPPGNVPGFDGREDQLFDWLNAVNIFFMLRPYAFMTRVALICESMRIADKVRNYISLKLMSEELPKTWPAFLLLLKERFGPVDCEITGRKRLAGLRFLSEDQIDEFLISFQRAAAMLTSPAFTEMKVFFLSAVGPVYAEEVLKLAPTRVDDLVVGLRSVVSRRRELQSVFDLRKKAGGPVFPESAPSKTGKGKGLSKMELARPPKDPKNKKDDGHPVCTKCGKTGHTEVTWR